MKKPVSNVAYRLFKFDILLIESLLKQIKFGNSTSALSASSMAYVLHNEAHSNT
jgi:hypothetical protein